MVMIKFGPAGIGNIREVEKNFEIYHSLGFRVAEIPFTYGVYIKKNQHRKEIEEIKKQANKFEIKLSIHAPYWINLNSNDNEKVEASKKRILDSCEIANLLDAQRVVFHCGFYGEDKGKAFENIRFRILEMMEICRKNKWDVELCPEVMGKKNVFGSVEEISNLVEETGCGFCIDFAHILARYGSYNSDLIKKNFPQKRWHCHFSGIDYGEKGERNHRMADAEEWKKFLKGIPSGKEVEIICESPNPVEDCMFGLKLFSKK